MEKVVIVLLIILILVTLIICNFPLAIVEGNSMYPTYKEGSVLLATRLFNIENLKVGDICIYHRGENIVIKRITRIQVDVESNTYSFYFEGDNAENSYDSRHYGYVNEEMIIAKVLWKLKY